MKAFKHITVYLIVAILVFSSISCNSELKVRTDRIDMCVGDFVDIADYADNFNYISVSDNEVVMLISETVLNALKPGTATVTIRKGTKTATINVYVKYAPTNLTVSCDSPLYTTEIGSVMTFTADFGQNSDMTDVVWYVNDVPLGVGKKFMLSLNEYKKYNVKAVTYGCEYSLSALCYKPFANEPTITSNCDDILPEIGEVEFTVQLDDSYSDPTEICWYVDGLCQYESTSCFAFTPSSAGWHTVYACVNGIKTNEITFAAKGKAEIGNVYCDYDTDYPNVYLRWDGPASNYEVSVMGTTYTAESGRFSGNSFDLTNLVDIKNSSVVYLRCMGDEIYSPSEIKEIKTPAIPGEAESFLNRKYFNGNYYMSSFEEVLDIVSYAIICRPNVVGTNETVSFSVYIGYDTTDSAAMLLSKAWAITEQTGSYSLKAKGQAKKNSSVTFEITFLTTNVPSETDVSINPTYESLITPHLSSGSKTLPIENKPLGGEVVTSDQLYYVVQKGYKPQPKPGSAAERIYAKAKDVLGKILSDDMSEVQTAEAIYDWIMWNTVYDYRVAKNDNLVALAVAQPAYYLEGVFDTGFAVCDGIAKSMSLLCNMAGLPCVRVIGTADNGKPSRHAWNKVMVDGKWYIVDATWGDTIVSMEGTEYEGALHYYFLKADSQMTTHKPTYPERYPKAEDYYDWYKEERAYDNKTGSLYVGATKADDLVGAIYCALDDMTFSVNIGDETYKRDFYCLEIKLSFAAKNYYRLHIDELTLIASSIISQNRIYWIISNDLLLIMVYND